MWYACICVIGRLGHYGRLVIHVCISARDYLLTSYFSNKPLPNKTQKGVCQRHGAKPKTCSVEGCNNQSQRLGLCCRHGGAKRKRKTPDEADTDEEEECIKAQQVGGDEDEKMPAIADEANDVPVAQVVNGKTVEEEETETVQI